MITLTIHKQVKSTIVGLILIFGSITLISSKSLAITSPTAGHICSDTQCMTCDVGSDGCLPDVCNAFICENVDKIPPIPPIIINTEELKETINGQLLRLAGVGEASARLIVTIDGKDNHESAIGGDSQFEITFNPGLSTSGTYRLAAYQIDKDGNKGDPSTDIIITVSTDKPTLKLVNVPSESNFKTVLISGNTDKGNEVAIYGDNIKQSSTGADENGLFDLILKLNQGINKFQIKSIDHLGNTTSKDITIKFDPSSSALLVLEHDNNHKLSISVPSGMSYIKVIKNDKTVKTFKINGTKFEIDLNKLVAKDKSANFELIGVDSVGNSTTPLKYTIHQTIAKYLLTVLGILTLIILLITVIQFKKGKLKILSTKKQST